jgi:hypothetical protein
MSTNFVYSNFFNSSLAAPIVSTSATTMTLSSTTNAPTITGGQIWAVVLNDAATQSVFEIVYVTARTGAVCTITRGQEGTAAATWLANDYAYAPDTAGILANFALASVAGATAIDTSSTAQTKIGTLQVNGAFSAGGTGSSTAGDITASRSSAVGLYAFGTSAAHSLDFGITTANTFTFSDNVKAQNLIDTNTANQVITSTKSITSVLSVSGSSARLVLTGTGTNGLYVSPNTDTQSGTFVITNAAISQNLLNFTQVNSSAGQLNVAGQIVTFAGGTFSNPGSGSGDMVVQRNNAGGVIFMGGAANSGSLDWNINTSAQFTFRNTGVGYGAVTGATYTTISDASIKTNIKRIDAATATILALKPVTYDHVNEDQAIGGPGIGFIAQDVELVLPALVTTLSDKKKGVAYHGFSPILVAAFQEFYAEFKAYKAAHP